MPFRKTPIISDNYYHIYNRSVARMSIFTSKIDFTRALELIYYLQFAKTPCSYSQLKKLSRFLQEDIIKSLEGKNKKLITIVCYCLMPNHFHFLVKQNEDNGTMIFLRNFQNSYAKFFNIKQQRIGPLFQGRFKAKLIEDDTQLLHLSRYIHLNPYTSYVVKDRDKLIDYLWSSFPQYLGKRKGFCQSKEILEHFKDIKDYSKFVFDRADYQKELEKIKHLVCE